MGLKLCYSFSSERFMHKWLYYVTGTFYNEMKMFKRRVYKCHYSSDPKGYFRMVRPLIKELITEEMLELMQLTQGLISSVIQKS